MTVYLNGLMLGLSLIMALGPQNVFLIRQGTLRKHAVLSVVICFCCDIILIFASVVGLSKALMLRPELQYWMTWFGVGFLLVYGIRALKQAFTKQSEQAMQLAKSSNRWQIVFLALGFSLLNPHAIIDSLVIIGSGSSQFPDHPQVFMFGVISASLLWFSSLTFTAHYFSDLLARTTVWRRIELSSGLLMMVLSLKLASTQF